MKKQILISLLLASLLLSVACNSLPAANTESTDLSIPIVQENNVIGASSNPESGSLSTVSNSLLSDPEVNDLLYMREEEKLAHDVYVILVDRWGVPVFNNIAGSELNHASSVLTLLDRYGIADPAEGLNPGQFNNSELQDLYNQLVEQGSLSLNAALKVGAAIEEIDILDLQDANTRTNQADIQLVYDNLLQGSYNHLRSFVNTLRQQTGETYQPQYLSMEEYQTIIEGSMGNGMSNSGQGQPGGKGQGNPNRN